MAVPTTRILRGANTVFAMIDIDIFEIAPRPTVTVTFCGEVFRIPSFRIPVRCRGAPIYFLPTFPCASHVTRHPLLLGHPHWKGLVGRHPPTRLICVDSSHVAHGQPDQPTKRYRVNLKGADPSALGMIATRSRLVLPGTILGYSPVLCLRRTL